MRHPIPLLLALAACASPRPSTAPLDLIVEKGRVYDGTGAPWFTGDVGIQGDRIVAVGNLSAVPAARRIDATGLAVAPGFIDLLGQSELMLLIDNRAESKVRQGITTEITGEGSSIAPLDDELIKDLEPIAKRFGVQIDWRDLNGYFARLERSGSAINLGTFLGAANVRALVLGQRDVQPTPTQLAQMVALAEVAFQQGALGLSTALIYPPGSYAKTDELVALAKVAARHGGLYASHIRGEADVVASALNEAIDIGRRAGLPVEIFHLKAAGRANWGRMKELISRIEAARAEGVDVAANMYPYAAANNGLDASIPGWAHDGGTDAMIARFHDPAQRARIKAELWHSDGMGDETPEGILLLSAVNLDLKKHMGKRLSDAARGMGKSPEDALLDLVEADRGNLQVVRFVMNEDDVRLGLAQPWVAIGSDSGGQSLDGPFAGELTHPRAFGAAARLLGKYARAERLMPLEEAVRRLTSLPAQRIGLWDRGLLRPGFQADVVVFDPERIRDVATFEDPLRYAEGVSHVLVNGRLVLDGGRFTSERPGRPLRRSR